MCGCRRLDASFTCLPAGKMAARVRAVIERWAAIKRSAAESRPIRRKNQLGWIMIDHETCRLEQLDNPSARKCYPCLRYKP